MTSKATRRFWRLYQELPEPIQRLAVKITGSGATIPVIRRLVSRNLPVAANVFPSVWAIITALWDTKSAMVLSGCGLVHTKTTINSWVDPAVAPNLSTHIPEPCASRPLKRTNHSRLTATIGSGSRQNRFPGAFRENQSAVSSPLSDGKNA